MPGRFWLVLVSLGMVGIFSLVPLASFVAQTAYIVSYTSPDLTKFPQISAYLDVHDPAGGFVHELNAQDVTIQENGLSVPVTELTEQKPGVQFVVAISSGPSFGVRDAAGISRYESLLQGIFAGTWATHPTGRDDLSLLTLGGPLLTHSEDPAQLHSMLETYTPDDSDTTEGLEVLASAMQLASSPTPRPGMERAILFITPPQPSDVSLGLQSIISSASQQNIHVNVWLVAPPENLQLPETDLLRNLATQTHATFFAFSHDEPVPDLESLLEPLRYIYQLGYESRITAPGTQQVAAVVSLGGESITTQVQEFELDLQPPALVLMNPSTDIVRHFAVQPTSGNANVAADLLPQEEPVDIKITFPDGYTHSLVRTSLFIDGALVAENTSPPFEQFIWDLRPYTQDGTHTLRVEAVDNLGMVGQTGEVSIQITVPSAKQEVATVISQNRLLLVGVMVLISASILVLVLILGGRIRPKPYPGQVRISLGAAGKSQLGRYRERMRQMRDPVTQPIKVASTLTTRTGKRITRWLELLPWFSRRETPAPTLAHLMPLAGTDEPTLSTPLHIKTDQVTLGSDPQKADLVIVDPSIEGLHARIHREGQNFIITDAGSIAGTWVNYTQVPSTGTKLEHANIVHLGKIGFRFNLSEPGTPRKVIVTPLERHR